MRTTFYIELNMKTAIGFECYGCFDLGYDRDFALNLFSKLEGQPAEGDAGVLQMDLIEKFRGLPVNMQVINCSIEELSRNVKVITRELFRQLSLDEAAGRPAV
ncbi:MAG: hypothetical protein JST68_14345 [Bacteroidetes bacterium]|nr:hypothetical protein [Bacteroidota bacterium]